ncbi:WGxxGxxG family protein [Mycobacterium sp. URHB0021]
MRKTLGITLTTAALLFGGAGVAHGAPSTSMPSSTTTTLADDATTDHDSDKTGLWGLAGLLGLLGLAGLKRRNDPAAVAPGTPGYGTAPRA